MGQGNQSESPAVVWYSAYKSASNDVQTSKASRANSCRSSLLGRSVCVCFICGEEETERKRKILNSEVSVGRYVVWPRCCCRGCYILGQEGEKPWTHYGTHFFICCNFLWLNKLYCGLILKDVLRVPQVRRSPRWGEDALWKHTLTKKTKQLDCVFMNGYCRYNYEQQFSSLQILRSSCFRQWRFVFCQILISAQLTVHSPSTVLNACVIHIILQKIIQPHFVPKHSR